MGVLLRTGNQEICDHRSGRHQPPPMINKISSGPQQCEVLLLTFLGIHVILHMNLFHLLRQLVVSTTWVFDGTGGEYAA